MAGAVRLAVRPDSVAVLTFDQPGSKANVLNTELWAEFESALDSLAPRTDLKGLVLDSAKPGIFIAGADLKLLANAAGPNDPAVRGFIEQGLRVLGKLESLPFPTCAAIDGAALGGGLEVALACDFRVCGTGDKVRLGLPEVTLGLIPGWGGTQRLPRITSLGLAAEMVVSGKPIEALRAGFEGLTNGDVPSDRLTDLAAGQVLSVAPRRETKLRAVPIETWSAFTAPADLTGAAAEAVRVMVEGARLPLKEGIAVETEAFMRLAGSDESKRRIAEFFAGRKK